MGIWVDDTLNFGRPIDEVTKKAGDRIKLSGLMSMPKTRIFLLSNTLSFVIWSTSMGGSIASKCAKSEMDVRDPSHAPS